MRSSPHPNPNARSAPVSLKLTPDTKKKLDALAAWRSVSVNSIVEGLIETEIRIHCSSNEFEAFLIGREAL